MQDQAELLAVPLPAVQEQRTWPELEPTPEVGASLPPHARYQLGDPVTLEITGLTSHLKQGEFIARTLLYKESIVAKLRGVGAYELATPLAECHTQESFAQCQGCRKVKHFWNHCDHTCCPTCAPGLAAERRAGVEWWANLVKQPKHVVLTCRNTAQLTSTTVRSFKQALVKLRRRKLARNWRGGLWSLEVTNEGRGWHLHAHLLVDVPWIDPAELALQWGKLVGQDYAIVKVKDARQRDYLHEVCKYAVKGSELAAWTGEDIQAFMLAMDGHRTFGVFGSLYGKRTEWREWIKANVDSRKRCECGCNQWKVYSAKEWLWRQETIGGSPLARANAPCETIALPLRFAHAFA